MGQPLFAKTIVHIFSDGGEENKEVVKPFMNETTKQLQKYLEKKWNLLL